jgi:indolepyruvate ferredoxin oxidoreductase, beta subunit
MAKVKEINVIICGVGGQGTVLMSELLGNAAVRDGLNVKGSEVLGMAQRGGSVFSNIRLGSDAYAPLTPEGKCHIMVAIEPSEALRNIHFLANSSMVILNTRKVIPASVSMGKSVYPTLEQIVEKLSKVAKNVITLDATQLAQQAGNILATNVVMLGALFGSGLMPIKVETVKATLQGRLPARVLEANMRAFDLGFQECQKSLQGTTPAARARRR